MIVHGHETVLVQGITGTQATFWSERMKEYGTKYLRLLDNNHQQPVTDFRTEIDPAYWTNRTIYTAEPQAADNMRRLMEEVHG